MALDDSDTRAGCQFIVVFPQPGCLLLKLPQVHRRQRQAQTPIAYKGNIVATKDDRPEWDIIASVFAFCQLDLDRQILVWLILVWLINDPFAAIFINNVVDEPLDYRIECFLGGDLYID